MNARRIIAASLLASLFGLARVEAYVEVELDSGRVVVGNVFQERERTIVVYSPSGSVEIDRAKVRRVEEHVGNLPSITAPSRPLPPAPSVVSGRLPKRPPESFGRDEKDPAIRDEKLARQLIFLYRDRAMAMNHNDRQAVDALTAQIEALEAERAAPVAPAN